MSAKTHLVPCPFCEGMIEIDATTGAVLKKWPKSDLKSDDTTDRMASALKKLEEEKRRRGGLFEKKKSELEGQKKKLENSFQSEVERVKKEGISDEPLNPFDME